MSRQDHLDRWWHQQFRRLLQREEAGDDVAALFKRWLVLQLHVFPSRRRPRWSIGFNVPEAIYHFLSDTDVRAKDVEFGRIQRAYAREWLNA